MEKFNRTYGHYPKYPVADAGYGSYNNYLYCEEHGMEKYMKFTMYKKETTDKKYHENPYRAVKSWIHTWRSLENEPKYSIGGNFWCIKVGQIV